MNREQRRLYKKQLKAKGYTEKKIEVMLAMQDQNGFDVLKEGQRVKLDIEKIKSHPDYDKNIDSNKQHYHDFVDANADKVFTVGYDSKYTKSPTIVCLNEDSTDPKWLWWAGDLIKVNDESDDSL